MDINHLFECEQIERVRADRAGCAQMRSTHRDKADAYRVLIADYRARVVAAFGARARPIFT